MIGLNLTTYLPYFMNIWRDGYRVKAILKKKIWAKQLSTVLTAITWSLNKNVANSQFISNAGTIRRQLGQLEIFYFNRQK